MKNLTLLILVLFISSVVYGQEIITIEGDDVLFQIGDKCSVRPASEKNPSVEDVKGAVGFQKSNSEHIQLGGRNPDDMWVKFTVQNKTKENIYLESLLPDADILTLYCVENSFLTQLEQSGQSLPFSKRALDINNPTFTIKPSDKPVTYVLLAKVKWASDLKLRLGTSKSIVRDYHHNALITGFFVGILFLIIMYKLFIYINVRDSIYLNYCVYMACLCAFALRYYGYTFEFVTRDFPQINNYTMILQGLAGLSAMVFIVKILNVKETLPKFNQYINGIYTFFVLDIVFALVGLWEMSKYMSYMTGPISMIVIAIISFKLKKERTALLRYCLYAWVCLSIGVSILTLENIGILPFNNFTHYTLYAGIVIHAFFLSFAFADRFGLINTKNQYTQAQMILALEENKRLTDEKNKMLEETMKGHNSALEYALSRVNESEVKLQDYARQLEKSNRELTEFAHIASHDLKAPIRGILSFSQLFERRNKAKFDDVDREYFNYIKSNASQSARLIEDLLNYSKIDKNLGDAVNVDLNDSVFLATMNLQNIIQERNAEIVYKNLPTVLGHSSLMTHLLQNLIGNGIKYNKTPKPVIEIKVQESGNNEVIYSVKDNGIGIPLEHQKEVFSMFRRLHGQAEYEGTGIGLSFCTRIVETYGGRIWIDSIVDVGTTFHFTLPKAEVVKTEKTELEGQLVA